MENVPEFVLYEGRDLARMHEAVAAQFAPHRLRLLGQEAGPASFRVSNSQGDMALYRLRHGADVEIRPVALQGLYLIHIPLAGRSSLVVDGEPVATAQDVVSPGQRMEIRRSHDSDMMILRIPRPVLDRAIELRGIPVVPGVPVRFTPAIDIRSPGSRAWLRTLHAYAEALKSGLLACSPLGTRHFEQLLAHGLLDSQPSSLSESLRRSARHAALPGALRRAMTYCDEHAGEPLSIADMALASGLSVPALRAAFRAHLGTTPLMYLRRVRLDSAHQDLLAIAEGRHDGTVTDVALRWGFVHLGRFAALYKATYGTVPSRTAGLRGYPETARIRSACG
ncbi:AraC family transcriptional regulator [Streptomyces rishiriensis]|uniref:AraC family transcriptional regulator n=1 Tax=Streptomyces rishiriensis TaxID=68264 RepID=UPI000D591A62|nr:AraC family transcriptional regulator [Streptomyces rishiriensis]